MSYYISKTITGKTIAEVRKSMEAALAEQGFGILTEIDMQATMKKKLDKDYPPFLILGACNPVFADKVLQVEPAISTLLPCNVVLRQLEDSVINVIMMDPSAAMGVVENGQIATFADEVGEKLRAALDKVN